MRKPRVVTCPELSDGTERILGSQDAQTAMWSVIAVVVSPGFNIRTRNVQRLKPALVQAISANSSVEGLDQRGICRVARLAEVESDLIGN